MSARFIAPYPNPHGKKSSLIKRFVRGWNSWIHVLFDKSYTMKMGEIHTPAMDFYMPNELSLVRRILDEEPEIFPKHRFLQQVLDPLIGNSVFSANGQDWAEQRAMVNPAFSHTALGRAFPLMKDAVDDLVARIGASDLSGPVLIDPWMTHVAADIIFRTMFSQALAPAASQAIHHAFQDYQKYAQRSSMLRIYGLPTLGYYRKAQAEAARIHGVFTGIVAERYTATHDRGERGDDILQSLIDVRHPQSGEAFTERQIMEQISTVFLAGHETSAGTMAWTLYLLARAPELQDAILAEITAVAGQGPLAYEHLKSLRVTRNVFRETLRLYPPVSFLLREVTCPVDMRDKHLKPGAMLVVSPWLIHRNRENFPEPHGFDPDRFDDPDQAGACRHAYLPYGKGPRTCVGAGFAQQEGILAIAELVRAFRIETAGEEPEPISRLTLRARNGIRLRLSRR